MNWIGPSETEEPKYRQIALRLLAVLKTAQAGTPTHEGIYRDNIDLFLERVLAIKQLLLEAQRKFNQLDTVYDALQTVTEKQIHTLQLIKERLPLYTNLTVDQVDYTELYRAASAFHGAALGWKESLNSKMGSTNIRGTFLIHLQRYKENIGSDKVLLRRVAAVELHSELPEIRKQYKRWETIIKDSLALIADLEKWCAENKPRFPPDPDHVLEWRQLARELYRALFDEKGNITPSEKW